MSQPIEFKAQIPVIAKPVSHFDTALPRPMSALLLVWFGL
jgi:hypothetical protein